MRRRGGPAAAVIEPPEGRALRRVVVEPRTSLRHVEVIAKVLGTRAAERLTPEVWAAAEAELAAHAPEYTPTELQAWGTELVDAGVDPLAGEAVDP